MQGRYGKLLEEAQSWGNRELVTPKRVCQGIGLQWNPLALEYKLNLKLTLHVPN
jgi:hypothetical protein